MGDSRRMNAYQDPYARLATVLWLLKPADVARLVRLADALAETRLAGFLDEAVSNPKQAPPGRNPNR